MPFRPILPDDEDLRGSKIYDFLKYPKDKQKLIEKTELIIVDEVSMVRADMIDFMDSNMNAEVTNILNGKCSMSVLNDQYTKILLTESSVVEMLLLETQMQVDSVNQILCVVKTFGTDIKESTIDFYSVKWRRLKTEDYMTQPDADIWTATWNQQDAVMTIKPVTALDPPANEEQKAIEKPLINLKWDGLNLK